jgi:hypothetical protein
MVHPLLPKLELQTDAARRRPLSANLCGIARAQWKTYSMRGAPRTGLAGWVKADAQLMSLGQFVAIVDGC